MSVQDQQPERMGADVHPSAGASEVALTDHPVLDAGVLHGFHLLEADAGTGKTWTIARLVLRAILEAGLTIDQIVVVTFTTTAAAELKARIAALLDAWSEGVPADDDPFSQAYQPALDDEQIARLVRQARMQLDDAPISTIHGFCQRVLSEQALSLGHWGELDVGADDSPLITEAVADWWRREIVAGPPARRLLIGRYGLSFASLIELLKRALRCPDAGIVNDVEGDWTTLADRLHEQVALIRQLLTAQQDDLLAWMGDPSNLNQTTYKVDKLEERFGDLQGWLEGFPATIDEDRDVLSLFDVRRISLKKSGRDERARFTVLAAIAGLNDLRLERAALVAGIGAMIRAEVAQSVEQRKRLARQISFDDLLNRTREALVDDDQGVQLAGALARRFPMALIDEFQDTDPAQWTIFSQIYEPGRDGAGSTRENTALVLVGDPKQAIYSFRNADVQTYLAARDAGARVHRLGQNQRSSRLLVDAINRLHEHPNPFGIASIAFAPAGVGTRADDPERQPPADDQGALTFVKLSGVGADSEPSTMGILADRAAQTCAHQIQLLLAGDPERGIAPERPADIAVLTRTLMQAGQIKTALSERGINAVEISRDSVLLSAEADDLARILAAVANPRDDRLVRSALTTTLIGFDLSDLQSMHAAPALWDSHFAAFDLCQSGWLRQGPEASLRDLLFGHFDRAAALVAMRDGERRMTNVLHLFDVLGRDEHAGQSAALAGAALTRLRQQAQELSGADEASEVRLESDDALVRILTIHSSKGLEFPIVFLPFLWSGNPSRASSFAMSQMPAADGTMHRWIGYSAGLSILKNPKWGIAPDSPLSVTRLAEQASQHDLEEGLRLCYVALTRASRRCVVYWGYKQEASRAIRAGAGALGKPSPREGGIGYLLDGQTGLADEPVVARVAERVDELAATQPGVTAFAWHVLQDLPVPQRPVAPDVARRDGWPVASALQLRQPVPVAPPAWFITSFTGLMNAGSQSHDMSHLAALTRPDHDEMLSNTMLAEPAVPSRDIRTRFDRGSSAGSCLHEMLEHLDFRAPVEAAGVAQVMARYGIEQPAAEVAGWLEEVLAAPLKMPCEHDSFRLAEVAPDDMITELDYLLPVRQARAGQIARRVGQSYPLAASLDERAIDGFMTGFIDLIVRRDGRYYLLDWKSNWLDADAGAYGPALMERSIAEHGYALQFCLYAVALQRWLRHCLPDYRYEDHFGGVFYLFIRGTGLPGAPADNGVYTARPDAALLDELDALLDVDQEAAR